MTSALHGLRAGGCLGLVVLWAALALPASAGPQDAAPRESLEAAFLVNFVRFSQWPAARFPEPRTPVVVTVVGSEDVADAVRAVSAAAGEVHGRRIEVRRVRGRDVDTQRRALRDSHVVFVDRSAGVPAIVVVEAVEGAAVLTVGDAPGFVEAGGMLGLVTSGRRLAFVANTGAIRRSPVEVSAKVLKLARATQP